MKCRKLDRHIQSTYDFDSKNYPICQSEAMEQIEKDISTMKTSLGEILFLLTENKEKEIE